MYSFLSWEGDYWVGITWQVMVLSQLSLPLSWHAGPACDVSLCLPVASQSSTYKARGCFVYSAIERSSKCTVQQLFGSEFSSPVASCGFTLCVLDWGSPP